MRKFFDHQRETKTEDALERPVMIVFRPSAHAVVVPACALGRKKEGLVPLLAGCAWDSSQRSRTREECYPEALRTFSHFNTPDRPYVSNWVVNSASSIFRRRTAFSTSRPRCSLSPRCPCPCASRSRCCAQRQRTRALARPSRSSPSYLRASRPSCRPWCTTRPSHATCSTRSWATWRLTPRSSPRRSSSGAWSPASRRRTGWPRRRRQSSVPFRPAPSLLSSHGTHTT